MKCFWVKLNISRVYGLTGSDDAFAGGNDVPVGSVGGNHSVIRLSALQVVHRELCPGHVCLQYHGVVIQTSDHHLEVHKVLRVRAGPAQL